MLFYSAKKCSIIRNFTKGSLGKCIIKKHLKIMLPLKNDQCSPPVRRSPPRLQTSSRVQEEAAFCVSLSGLILRNHSALLLNIIIGVAHLHSAPLGMPQLLFVTLSSAQDGPYPHLNQRGPVCVRMCVYVCL